MNWLVGMVMLLSLRKIPMSTQSKCLQLCEYQLKTRTPFYEPQKCRSNIQSLRFCLDGLLRMSTFMFIITLVKRHFATDILCIHVVC